MSETTDEFAALAAEFFAGDFEDATITRETTASFNPITGTVASTTTAIPCRALQDTVTTKAPDGTIRKHTTFMLSVEPLEGDRLTIAGKTYTLGTISAEAPHGVAILWEAVARS